MTASTGRVSVIIGTAGHIDHGKTTLIKALTGMDTDRLREEKRRGLSIDLGFAHMELTEGGEKLRAAIVDVPGHERFIRNMLAGATGMEMVLFTVAADDGVMPQTVEHLDILSLLGIKRVFFVITKCDLVTEVRLKEVEAEIGALIKRAPHLKGAPFFRVSAVTGEGIEGLKGFLCNEIRGVKDRKRGRGWFRLPVDRSFSIKGFGTVITGTVASGTVKTGETVLAFPEGKTAKVRGIETMHQPVETVSKGERAALNLTGVTHRDFSRGTVVASPGLNGFMGGGYVVDCFFEFLPARAPLRVSGTALKDGALVKLHHQAEVTLARVRFAGRKDPPRGGRAFGRLYLKRPLLMLSGDRFILRDPSVNATTGGGMVFMAYPERELICPLKRLKAPDESGGLAGSIAWVLPERWPGIDVLTLSLALNLKEGSLEDLLNKDGLLGKEFLLHGDFLLSIKRVRDTSLRIVEILKGFHASRPLMAGMEEDPLINVITEQMRVRTKKTVVYQLIREVIECMVRDKIIVKTGSSISLPSHRAAVAGVDSKIEGAVRGLFSSRGVKPVRDLEIKGLSFEPGKIDEVMDFLMRQGTVVRLAPGVFISGDTVEIARERLMGYIKENGAIRASEFRDILGCGRKLAIEILEYFDRERVTLRKGDMRILR